MAKLKKVYVVYACDSKGDLGEIEGVYDVDKEEWLDFWFCNDANWRGEYFNGFLRTLGIDVAQPDKKLFPKLQKELIKHVDQQTS